MDSVVLISKDQIEFEISKESAILSPTLKTMLEGPFIEKNGKIELNDIESEVLSKIIDFLNYKLKYKDVDSNTDIPEFEIPTEMSLELLLAADYLQL
ncbi:hypothetical protein Kpol_333p8 [Vanderwaltozyma polyspora DSM 70294]|uniref:Elongin-C n=1 Tax=Vanderwaltozyma polyspora (strain ATCC 22028 / DSM 70294 / BCRC 21397 / CBS 2163 / NBRC 10782 / NRRL Y-8283 / UCD 57-17) TaxID=436907 RepID=A7TSM5_VANPO|nr:uncharacterized protein Kpol_333p8 [Vanderwaltozyma polyspora DSM 70294]EDO14738.1 hypothetical protein Kpol_333p8 [Vanderwaltozyma polyspora DSM 70294]